MDDLELAVAELITWVIPTDDPTTYARKASHEAAEFAAEPSVEEAADVLLCVMGWAIRSAEGWDAVRAAALRKVEANMDRRWEKQPDGTWQHVT